MLSKFYVVILYFNYSHIVRFWKQIGDFTLEVDSDVRDGLIYPN